MRIYDISVAIAPGETPTYPGDPGVEIETWASISKGDAANVSMLHFGAHTATHVDAPAHFIEDAPGLPTLALETLIGPAQSSRLRVLLAMTKPRRRLVPAGH